jgi:hypothetical protein
VVLAWLRAERHSRLAAALLRFPAPVWQPGLTNLLDQADLNDPEQNRARLRLLYVIRNIYVLEIPPDTEWYEVASLTDADLAELHAVNHQTWTDANDRNELQSVAMRKRLAMSSDPSTWDPPILWGHDRSGPFTILEGNNRLTAYAGSGRTGLSIPVLVGLSAMKCVWHILDGATPLVGDLIGG